ncbi:MAG: 4-amino-4-deoxy-L-arabinose transferase, partial [Nocardioidaceae bacterium]
SYTRGYDEYVSLLVWVDAPADVRKRRALTRDGDVFAPYWDQWAADEARVLAREGTRDRADVVVDA